MLTACPFVSFLCHKEICEKQNKINSVKPGVTGSCVVVVVVSAVVVVVFNMKGSIYWKGVCFKSWFS